MNQEQIMGTLRILISTVLSYAVGKGWLSSSQVADLTAAIVTISAVIWSFTSHSQHAQIANVAAMPEVKNITTTKAIAEAIPSTKVTNGFVAPVDKKP
jgi:hypothetical protein